MNTTTGLQIGASERAVQNRLVALFRERLGYRYLGNRTEDVNFNVNAADLQLWLMNRGVDLRIAEAAVRDLQGVAGDLSSGDLYKANKAVYSKLKYGANVSNGKGGYTTIPLIDFANPEANDFAIAEEVTVAGFYDKRPDLVVYVNGIALGVIELKRANVSVVRGISQNLANQEAQFIRPFFTTMQLVCAGNPSEGLRYGTILTDAKHYLEWRADGYKKHPEERDANDVRLETEAAAFAEKLDAQVYELFDKKRFLDLVRNFIVFDRGQKKVCRYCQYYGVKRALARTGKHAGGIIWASQGSGKSIEMVMLAKQLLERDPNGRVLIVTDREELDDQIEKLFKGVEETIVRTASCKDLIEKVGDISTGRLVCSLIMKFGRHGKSDEQVEEESVRKYIEDLKAALPKDFQAQGNFTVFVDECHRTQSGKLHAAMKAILPDAVFVGFTGTPLLKKDKDRLTSPEIFGDYIHTYKFPEAVRDGVVLDLRYEARDVPQDVTAQDQIDKWFEAKTAGLTSKAKATLKQRWATMQNVVSSKSRLAKIAEDIILDFATKPRLATGKGNAMLVAGDILSAFKYYNVFREHGFTKCAVISSYEPVAGAVKTEPVDPDRPTDEQVKYATCRKMVGIEDGADEASVRGKLAAFEAEAKRQFVEEPAKMQLLIVVDKLLTGFDAPPCTYLYIDKHMQDHGLFQAICRVNRLADPSKDFGYVVDYQKLFGDLKESLAMYSGEKAFGGLDPEDFEGFVKDVTANAKSEFLTTLEALEALCEGVEAPGDAPAYRAFFGCSGADTPEEEELFAQRREKMYRLVDRLARAYAAFKPRLEAAGVSEANRAHYEARVTFYLELKQDIGQASGDFLDLKPYEPDMRYLIDTYIAAGESERLNALDGFTLVDFIDDKTAEEKEKPLSKKERNGIAETIENNATKELVQKRLVNPAFFERMSEVLKKLIESRKAGVIEYAKLLEEYKKLALEIKDPTRTGRYPAAIAASPIKQALYDNFGRDEQLTEALHRAFLGSKLQGFKYSVVKQNKIKSALWKVLKNDDLVEKVYKILAAQGD